MKWEALPTPCYVVDEDLLKKNLQILRSVQDKTGCRILLAQKGFSMFHFYPLIGQYLAGTTASSLFEARLGHEEMGKEVHIYAPAYRDDEFDDIVSICDHIVFNSFAQWKKFKGRVKNNECGIRINPEYSEIKTEIYNPCAKFSRLGVTLAQFEDGNKGLHGLHFHTMCEQNSDTLKRTIEVIDKNFGVFIKRMKWVNFGGGHHITRDDYNIETLVECILFIKKKYNVDVYLEPGEAIALNTGFLVAEVLDIVHNNMHIAILNTSAACHMPDVLEMPYRPNILGADEKHLYRYRLAGPTCLAGDIIGDYCFKEPLTPGQRIIFCDMAHYTMVKNNTFNGVNLPAIAVSRNGGEDVMVIKQFGYDDFKCRLS